MHEISNEGRLVDANYWNPLSLTLRVQLQLLLSFVFLMFTEGQVYIFSWMNWTENSGYLVMDSTPSVSDVNNMIWDLNKQFSLKRKQTDHKNVSNKKLKQKSRNRNRIRNLEQKGCTSWRWWSSSGCCFLFQSLIWISLFLDSRVYCLFVFLVTLL